MVTFPNIAGFEFLIAMLCILGFVVLVIAVVILVVWLVRRNNKSTLVAPDQTASNQAALNIAQERYARGEITREQYQQIVADLSQK